MVSAAIQTLLSTPVPLTAAVKRIQKALGKVLPFKVWKQTVFFFNICECLNITDALSVILWGSINSL